MPLITLVLVLAVVGFALFCLLKWVPMAPPFPQIIVAVTVLVVLLWILSASGLIGPLQSIRVR